MALLSCLKELDLDENNISFLPSEIGELACLEVLLARGNGLMEIAEGVFEGLANLRVCFCFFILAVFILLDFLSCF